MKKHQDRDNPDHYSGEVPLRRRLPFSRFFPATSVAASIASCGRQVSAATASPGMFDDQLNFFC